MPGTLRHVHTEDRSAAGAPGGRRLPGAVAVSICVLTVATLTPARAQTGSAAAGDAARTYAHVRALAGQIGPRPAGSAGERAARRYVANALRQLGLEVRTLPVDRIWSNDPFPHEAVVGSGNVLGILPGQGPGAYLFAAHLDSRSPHVPGADDNASGVAALLESARLLRSAPTDATLLFLFTCAAEPGRYGARRFAATEELDRLDAVLALDAVGSTPLTVAPIPGAPPAWALQDLLAVAHPASVAAPPAWGLASRIRPPPFTADHLPFRDAGIPAFALTHRLQGWWRHHAADDPAVVDAGAVARAAEAIVDLVHRWDRRGVRESADDEYVVLPAPAPVAGALGRDAVLVPGWAIRLLVLGIVVVALPLYLVLGRWRRAAAARRAEAESRSSRQRDLASPPGPVRRGLGVVWSLVHAAGWAVAIVAGSAVPALALGRFRGWRYAWWAHPELHLALALAAGLMTGWLLIRVGPPAWPPRAPRPYVAGATLLWMVLTAAAGFVGGWSLALYPAVAGLGTMLLAALPGALLRLLVVVLSLYPLASAVELRSARELIDLGGIPLDLTAMLLPALLAWPAAAMVAASVTYATPTAEALARGARSGWTGAVVAGLVAVLGTAAVALPSYGPDARRVVRVSGEWPAGSDRVDVSVRSPENLRRLRGAGAAGVVDLNERRTSWTVPAPDDRPILTARLQGPGALDDPEGTGDAGGNEAPGLPRLTYELSVPWEATWAWISAEGEGLEIVRPDGLTSEAGAPYRRRHVAVSPVVEDGWVLASRPPGPVRVRAEVLVEEDLLGLGLEGEDGDVSIFYRFRIVDETVVTVDDATSTTAPRRRPGGRSPR